MGKVKVIFRNAKTQVVETKHPPEVSHDETAFTVFERPPGGYAELVATFPVDVVASIQIVEGSGD